MSDLSLAQIQETPFDSIRQVDADGEFWAARNLMPLLGYPRWADFEDVVLKAKAACKNAQTSVVQHFSGLTLKTKGRPQQDYRLSRYACYLTAGRDDLLVPVTRSATNEYPVPESIDVALDVAYGKERQRLVGE